MEISPSLGKCRLVLLQYIYTFALADPIAIPISIYVKGAACGIHTARKPVGKVAMIMSH